MEYGVFQINENGLLALMAQFNTKDEAVSYVKTGSRLVILEIYV